MPQGIPSSNTSWLQRIQIYWQPTAPWPIELIQHLMASFPPTSLLFVEGCYCLDYRLVGREEKIPSSNDCNFRLDAPSPLVFGLDAWSKNGRFRDSGLAEGGTFLRWLYKKKQVHSKLLQEIGRLLVREVGCFMHCCLWNSHLRLAWLFCPLKTCSDKLADQQLVTLKLLSPPPENAESSSNFLVLHDWNGSTEPPCQHWIWPCVRRYWLLPWQPVGWLHSKCPLREGYTVLNLKNLTFAKKKLAGWKNHLVRNYGGGETWSWCLQRIAASLQTEPCGVCEKMEDIGPSASEICDFGCQKWSQEIRLQIVRKLLESSYCIWLV